MEMKLSKLDVARRQLETAITLYFHESDPVSIHTLTAAAHGVLRDLSRVHEQGNRMMTDFIPDYVPPEVKPEFRERIAHRTSSSTPMVITMT
jgi:hypothetical protein